LKIHPLRRRRRARESETADLVVQRAQSAGRMVLAQVTAPSTVDGAADSEPRVATPIRNQSEEAHCSTNNLKLAARISEWAHRSRRMGWPTFARHCRTVQRLLVRE